MRAKLVEEYLQFAVENKFPVLLKGKPGIGKSEIIEQVAARIRWEEFYKNFTGYKSPELITKIGAKMIGAKLIISHPVVADPTDYKGLPFMVDGKASFQPFGDLQQLIDAKEPTLFFLDDLGQAAMSVQAAIMQPLLAGTINGHVISDHVVFIAATNRREDHSGVSGLLEALKSRWLGGIIELETNVEDWTKWALTHNMPTELIAFIQFKPEMLDGFKATRDLVNSPLPRTIAGVGREQNAGLPRSLQYEVFKGIAGEAFAVEYIAFLDLYLKLPSVNQIILNPLGTAIPDNMSAQYALMGAIAEKMEQGTIGTLTQYLNRMQEEIGVACMKIAATKNPSICNTREFITWASDKVDLFI